MARDTIKLSEDQRRRLRRLRIEKGLSEKALAERSNVDETTVKSAERLTPKALKRRFEPETISAILTALDKRLEDLDRDPAPSAEQLPVASLSFHDLEGRLLEADHLILKAIRDLDLESQTVEDAHRAIARGALQEQGLSLERFYALLHDRTAMESLSRSIPEPTLEIKVHHAFSRIEFIHESRILLALDSPKLLLDCSCSPGRADPRCPLHSRDAGPEVLARFYNGSVVIYSDGLRFLWKDNIALWPPSIDSFAMLEDIQNEGLLSDNSISSILDLGSGTGFLGIALASHNAHIRRLEFSDWLFTPLLYSMINWFLNSHAREFVVVRAHFGLFSNVFKKAQARFDVVVCNPPYLPLLAPYPRLKEIGMHHAVAGTDLLTDVIRRGKHLGNLVYVQFSHLAAPEAQESAKTCGATLKAVGPERKVPFRIKSLLKSFPEYLTLLERERGLQRIAERYWHTVQTYRIIS